MRIVQFSPLS
jgi:hypothetical protein